MLKAKRGANGVILPSTRLEVTLDQKSVEAANEHLAQKLPGLMDGRVKLSSNEMRDVLNSCGAKNVLAVGRTLHNHDQGKKPEDERVSVDILERIYAGDEKDLRTRPRRVGMDLMAAAYKTFTEKEFRDGGASEEEIQVAAWNSERIAGTPKPDPFRRVADVLDIKVNAKGMKFERYKEPVDDGSTEFELNLGGDEKPGSGKVGMPTTNDAIIDDPSKVKGSGIIDDMMAKIRSKGNLPPKVSIESDSGYNLVRTGDSKHMVQNVSGVIEAQECLYITTVNEPLAGADPHVYVLEASDTGLRVRNRYQVPELVKIQLGLEDAEYEGDGIPRTVQAMKSRNADPLWKKHIEAPMIAKSELEQELSRKDGSDPSAIGIIAKATGEVEVDTKYHKHTIKGIRRLARDGDEALYFVNAQKNSSQPGILRVDNDGMTVVGARELISKPDLAKKLGFELGSEAELIDSHWGEYIPVGATSTNKGQPKEMPSI